MPNFEYKNIDDILSSNLPKRGVTLSLGDESLLEKIPVSPTADLMDTDSITGKMRFNLELHLFLKSLVYVKSLYNIDDFIINEKQSVSDITLKVHNNLRKIDVPAGEYKIVYNFLHDEIGSFGSDYKLFVSEISSNRTELRVSLSDQNSKVGRLELGKFVLENLKPKKTIPPIVLNFGQNKFADVINITSNGDPTSFYVKLSEPLSGDVTEYTYCWISTKLMKPYIDTVNIELEKVEEVIPYIAGPNFEVDYDYWSTPDTAYKSWTDILGQNVSTSQELINRQISGSRDYVNLNIDYTNFNNFVHYSNAKERVENFFYKMELYEFYKKELNTLEQITSSVSSNKVRLQLLKEKVVSGLDNFEKYLFYDTTGSFKFTYELSASIVPYPKYQLDQTASSYDIATKEGKYNFYSYTSSYAENWYLELVDLASEYDRTNYDALVWALPEHVREDSGNNQIISFVNMLGQHFDIIFLYIDHILKKNTRKEHPKDGVSQDLIFELTRNMGWTLTHGTQEKDLWEYALGVSGSGDPIWTGKTTLGKYYAKSYEEKTKETWRRIYNNLPYIYKTKGTSRAIKALLAAYGIPQTLLTIREFGGPDNADLGIIPRTEWEKHTYYLNLRGSLSASPATSHVRVPWEKVNNSTGSWQYPDTVTFRWKMEPEDLYSYTGNTTQTLLQKQSGSRVDWYVVMNKNGSQSGKGTLTFYIGNGTTYTSASFYDEYFYDGIPLNLMIRRKYSNDLTASNQIYDIFVKTEKYGKLVIEKSGSITISGSLSGSYNQAWSSDGTLYIGSGSNQQNGNILSGSIFELRYWSSPLQESSFDNHVLAARSYNGNTPTSSFYDLQAQFKFWQEFDTTLTSSILSSHPNQNQNYFYTSQKTASLVGFNYQGFESTVETYNMEVATVGNNTPFSEKVRIDSGSLIGSLDPYMSSEVSRFDKFSQDSNKLMVAFSPQSIINEDIYESIGYTSIDDYFGEYSNINKEEYPKLKRLSREYWQKYPNKNDFTQYIKTIAQFDLSIFEQIRQTLPIRANEILGLVIEPNILERSKVKAVRNFTGESPEKVVKRTNEISSSFKTKASVSSYKTSILVGFDDESTYQELEGEIDSTFEIQGSKDISVTGDYNNTVSAKSFAKQYKMIITSSRGSFASFGRTNFIPYKAIISTFSSSSLNSQFNSYLSKIKNSGLGRIIGSIASGMGSGLTMVTASFNTGFTNTFDRTSIVYSPGSANTGYGVGWKAVTNDGGKSSALFTTYQNYRIHSYYSAYNFFYTSSRDMAERNYSSYVFVSSSYENPHNLPTPIRNHRFEGSKLTGPDINVGIKDVADGKPVVEVFIVDPNQINQQQNFVSTGN